MDKIKSLFNRSMGYDQDYILIAEPCDHDWVWDRSIPEDPIIACNRCRQLPMYEPEM